MRGHYIKPNHKCESLQHAIFFDTETDQSPLDDTTIGHTLCQGWAAYTRRTHAGAWSDPEWFKFDNIKTFWNWVELRVRPKTRLYMFCHNTNFDLPVLDTFQELPRRGWVPDRLVIEAPPTIIRCRKDKATILLLDTLNYWPISLKRLGHSIGIEKLDMPDKSAPQADWDTYNRRDVEIIMRAVQQWADMVKEHDLGGFQPTLASQAFNAWRHRFMAHQVFIDNHERALKVSRDCYHGGRTEAFYIGKFDEPRHLVDINSMYPHVMKQHTYPTSLAYYSSHMTPPKLRHLLKDYLCCARVNITIDKPAIGIINDGKFLFPIGTFNATLSTPELRWVYRHGKINSVSEVSAYKHAPLFRHFVKHMYKWRLDSAAKGHDVLAFMIKILMNSLYGKFGQRGIRFEEFDTVNDYSLDTWTEYNPDTGEIEQYRQLMGVIQQLHRDDESASSHPAIAAHVTAYARMLLWEYIEAAGRENVYYCDTDSLLVNDTGLLRLNMAIDPYQLGKLKHEGSFNDGEIHGAKDYRFGSKVRTKGVRPSAIEIAPNIYKQEKWSGLKGLLRRGQLDTPTTALIEKHLSRRYDKGDVQPDGSVLPWVFGAV